MSRLASTFLMHLALVAPVALLPAAELVGNGGFESGTQGWMWQQWKGKPLPGYIDKEDMHEGLASFALHQDGIEHELHLAREVQLDPSAPRDLILSISLKAQDMPASAARVRVLIAGHGWLNKESGRMDVITTGGTHDWKSFTAKVPASALGQAPKATLFIYHDKPSQGTLGIDALSLSPDAE